MTVTCKREGEHLILEEELVDSYEGDERVTKTTLVLGVEEAMYLLEGLQESLPFMIERREQKLQAEYQAVTGRLERVAALRRRLKGEGA